MTTTPDPNVAVELERLRGTLTTGFTDVRGTLALLVERTDRTQQDVRDLRTETQGTISGLRTQTETELNKMRTDIDALKARRWPVGQISTLTGVVAAAAAVITIYH